MSVQDAIVQVGATITQSGGTARNYIVTGKPVNNGVHLIDASASSTATAKHAYAVSKTGGKKSDGEYNLDQRSLRFVNPITSTKGNIVYPSIEVVLKVHPESTTANIDELKSLAIQGLIDTDFTNLFSVGSTR